MRAVLVLNAGSSSLKFALYPINGDVAEAPAVSGQVEGIGATPEVTLKTAEGARFREPVPTGGSQGEIVHTTGDPTYNAASSILGAPTVTVPVMAVAGLPVGVQVMGQHHMDERVVAIARWLAETVPAVELD